MAAPDRAWMEFYRAALLEVDVTLLPKRIAEAKSAMHQRLEELTPVAGQEAAEERQALLDALRNLRVIQS